MAFAEEDRIWHKRGWTAEILKSEDGDGWAVAMTRDGDEEPALVAPWTMGRNKKDPKPLNAKDFGTWLKTANEFLGRSQYQNRTAARNIQHVYTEDGEHLKIIFDVVRDDYEPVGVLTAHNVIGEEIARSETYPDFKLTLESAEDWLNSGFEPPVQEEEEFVDEVEEFVDEGDADYIDEAFEEEVADDREEEAGEEGAGEEGAGEEGVGEEGAGEEGAGEISEA